MLGLDELRLLHAPPKLVGGEEGGEEATEPGQETGEEKETVHDGDEKIDEEETTVLSSGNKYHLIILIHVLCFE